MASTCLGRSSVLFVPRRDGGENKGRYGPGNRAVRQNPIRRLLWQRMRGVHESLSSYTEHSRPGSRHSALIMSYAS